MSGVMDGSEAFIANISSTLGTLGIGRDELAMMDHICYRVETKGRYKELRKKLEEVATLIGETEVNGRRIATFELRDYLQIDGWTVPYFELPEPKEGSPYTEGFEHVEFVVHGSLSKFLTRHDTLQFDLKGMNKLINPEASLKTAGIAVKFHEQPLGAVVRIEERLGMTLEKI